MSITQSAAKNHQRQVASSTPESQATINVASGVARALGQGLTFGFADEAEAYLRSVVGNREYKEVRDEIRKNIDQFRKEEPALAYGSEIAASVATVFAPGGAAALATRMAPRVASAIAPKVAPAVSAIAGGPTRQAALAGGLYGAGVAEEVPDIPLSAATGAAVGGLAQKVTPQVTQAAKGLIAKGASLSPGEKYGGIMGAIEKGLETAPVVSGLFSGIREGLTKQTLAPVLYGEVAQSLGKKLSVGLSPRGAYEQTSKMFKEEYDRVLSKASLSVDSEFVSSLMDVLSRHSTGLDALKKSDMNKLREFIQKSIYDAAEDGVITGAKFKSIQSDIKTKTNKIFSKERTETSEENLADALLGIDDAMMSALSRSTPDMAAEIKKLNKAYSMFKPLERASVKAGTKEKSAFSKSQADFEIKRQAKAAPKTYIMGSAPMQKTVEQFYDVEPTVSAGLPTLGLSGAAAGGVTAPGAGTVGLSTAGTAALPFLAPIGGALLGTTKAGRSIITPRLPSGLPVVGGTALPGVIDVPSAAIRSPATAGLLSEKEGVKGLVERAGSVAAQTPSYLLGLTK